MCQTNKLEYQERLEAVTLPTLQYRRFRADMIETYKITHGHFEDNCVKHLFEMKSTNMRDHQYVIKIIHSKNATRRNYFALRVASVWSSLFSDNVESVSLKVIKKKLGDHCLTRNIVFDQNYDFLNALSSFFLVASFNCFIQFQVYLFLLLDILSHRYFLRYVFNKLFCCLL